MANKADTAVEVSIPFEVEEADRFETFLENIKYELRGQIQVFQMSVKNGSCKPERLEKIVELCEQVRDIISDLSSDLLQTNIVQEHPSLCMASRFRRLGVSKRDSGIMSETGSSADISGKGFRTNPPGFAVLNGTERRMALFTISPSDSSSDLSHSVSGTQPSTTDVPEQNADTSSARPTISTSGRSSPVTYRRESILSSVSGYCFSPSEVAENYKLRVITDNNQHVHFRLVPLTSSSSFSKLQYTGHRHSVFSHVSSNDSVMEMIQENETGNEIQENVTSHVIQEDVNGNPDEMASDICPLNDLSKKLSLSSEEDNTKQRFSSSVSEISVWTSLGGIVNAQLVRRN